MENKQLLQSLAKRAQIHKSENITPAKQAGGTGHAVDLPVFISVGQPQIRAYIS